MPSVYFYIQIYKYFCSVKSFYLLPGLKMSSRLIIVVDCRNLTAPFLLALKLTETYRWDAGLLDNSLNCLETRATFRRTSKVQSSDKILVKISGGNELKKFYMYYKLQQRVYIIYICCTSGHDKYDSFVCLIPSIRLSYQHFECIKKLTNVN